MSPANENSDITKSQESLIVGDESGGVSNAKEENVEAQTINGINPNKVVNQSETGGGSVPPGSRSGGGGGKGGPGGGGGKPSSEADSAELFTNWSEFIQFLKETYIEFRKISWPGRQQVLQETWSVIVLVSLLTGLVLCFDWGVAKVVFEPLDKFAKKLGGGVGNTMQNWGPMTPQGAPNNQPGAPANKPATPASSPEGKLNTAPATPVPAGQSEKSEQDTSSKSTPSNTEDAKPGDSK
jgi:preprotein translocase SecE subunit